MHCTGKYKNIYAHETHIFLVVVVTGCCAVVFPGTGENPLVEGTAGTPGLGE